MPKESIITHMKVEHYSPDSQYFCYVTVVFFTNCISPCYRIGQSCIASVFCFILQLFRPMKHYYYQLSHYFRLFALVVWYSLGFVCKLGNCDQNELYFVQGVLLTNSFQSYMCMVFYSITRPLGHPKSLEALVI